MVEVKYVPKDEHYRAHCGFCSNDKLTFHKNEKGEKILDKPCGCKRSKEELAKRKREDSK